MNIYIACGLTHVPRQRFDGYARFIHTLAADLAAVGARSVRYALHDSDPQLAAKPFDERARLCYLWDREMVESADIVIADATYPSIGLGIEMQLAEARGTPIIIAFERLEEHRAKPVEYVNPDATHHALQIGEGFVSLMALGLPSVFKVVPYASPAEGVRALSETVSLLRRE